MSEIRIKTLVVGMVGTNCYLVYDHETKRAAVIDPGDGAGQIANMAVSLGLKPEAILLTHGHFDHIMAAKELKETWNVPIYACEKEIDVLTDGQKSLVAGYFREPYTITPDVTVKEGDELSIAGFTWKVFEHQDTPSVPAVTISKKNLFSSPGIPCLQAPTAAQISRQEADARSPSL